MIDSTNDNDAMVVNIGTFQLNGERKMSTYLFQDSSIYRACS